MCKYFGINYVFFLLEGSVSPINPNRRSVRQIKKSTLQISFQLVQFEPGIWFPKTVTWESSYNPETKQGFRKVQMQVHKAVFNIPITSEDR